MSALLACLPTGLPAGSGCWHGTTTPACCACLVCALVVPLTWTTTTRATTTRHTSARHAPRAMPVGQHSRVWQRDEHRQHDGTDLPSLCLACDHPSAKEGDPPTIQGGQYDHPGWS